MFKILKYLKKSATAVIFIVLLLGLQAVFDLSLPDYTAQIVNVGINQNGVENPVPDAILQENLQDILLFCNGEEREQVLSHYGLLEPDTATDKDRKTYPALSEGKSVYVLKKITDQQKKDIETIISTPLFIKQFTEQDSPEARELLEQFQESMMKGMMEDEGEEGVMTGMPQGTMIPENATLFDILRSLPEAQREGLQTRIMAGIPELPEAQLSQAAAMGTVQEYKAVGLSIDTLRTRYILFTGLKMLAITLGSIFASVLVAFLSSRMAASLGKTLRSLVFKRVVDFSSSDLEGFGTASLITRNTNDVQQVQMMITILFRMVIYAPILGLYGFFKVLTTDSSMSWTIGLGILAIAIILIFLFVVALPKFKMQQKLIDRINLVAREILTGLPVIRAFANEKHEEGRFDKANDELTKVSLFVSRTMAIMMPTMSLILNALTLLIIWVGAHRVDSGNMQIGNMMAFIQYAMQVIMAFLMISMVSIILPRASVSAKRISEVLEKEPSIVDPLEQERNLFDESKKGLLEFRDVNFRYPGAQEDVLHNISFTARPGQTTAIIGSTGCGKSTLVNLIPRFFDVTGGTVLFDGADVRKVPQKELRKRIGFVPQKGVLFTGTIESNIKLGAKDADEETVKRAARIAQATDFIEEKQEGYESEISQGGTNVSGGQRQRLAIARAVAKNPEIYVFDDSFSALDYKTDRILRNTLKEELSDTTVVIVTQRISTVLYADQIIVLDEGAVVGIGTHRELLKTCDVYHQIASSQLSKEELEA